MKKMIAVRKYIMKLSRDRVFAFFLSLSLISSICLGCLPQASAMEDTGTVTIQTLDKADATDLLQEAAIIASQEGNEDDAHYFTTRAASITSNTDVEPYGLKSSAIKTALKAIARTLRSAPNTIINIAGNFLDPAAKKALRNNAGAIANALDRVANIPNLTSNFVRQAIFNALKGIVGAGTAEVIASAIEGILNFFVF